LDNKRILPLQLRLTYLLKALQESLESDAFAPAAVAAAARFACANIFRSVWSMSSLDLASRFSNTAWSMERSLVLQAGALICLSAADAWDRAVVGDGLVSSHLAISASPICASPY